MKQPPAYDEQGYNVLDQNDRLGLKSKYITLLHEKILAIYIDKGFGRKAIDIGCGYGRLTPTLSKLDWDALGIDPDENLINYARKHNQGPDYLVGSLPELPVQEKVDLILIQNLLRGLLLMDQLDLIKGIGNFIKNDAKLFLIDNIRINNNFYLSEKSIINLISNEGFKLQQIIPIRAARWWPIFLMKFGLIPTFMFDFISDFEIKKMQNKKLNPKWQYYNVLFIFKKVDQSFSSKQT